MDLTYEKLTNINGDVAVLYTPHSVWSSTARKEIRDKLIFDSRIAKLVLEGRCNEITRDFLLDLFTRRALGILPLIITNSAWDLEIAWVKPGRKFFISLVDGETTGYYENVVFLDEIIIWSA